MEQTAVESQMRKRVERHQMEQTAVESQMRKRVEAPDGANGGREPNEEAGREAPDGANGGGGANGEAGDRWAARASHQVVLKDGSFYLFGGLAGNGSKNDVWSSSDGKIWTEVLPDGEESESQWERRYGHQVVIKGEEFYLFGGLAGNGSKNDVWSSSDGKIWTEVLPDGEESESQWERRYGHQVVIKGDYFFLFGGNAKEYKNDVWKSRDGATWTELENK